MFHMNDTLNLPRGFQIEDDTKKNLREDDCAMSTILQPTASKWYTICMMIFHSFYPCLITQVFKLQPSFTENLRMTIYRK